MLWAAANAPLVVGDFETWMKRMIEGVDSRVHKYLEKIHRALCMQPLLQSAWQDNANDVKCTMQ
jgi:hypothetical protein